MAVQLFATIRKVDVMNSEFCGAEELGISTPHFVLCFVIRAVDIVDSVDVPFLPLCERSTSLFVVLE